MTGPADELITRLRELREQYRDAHRSGMAALERRDLDALDRAIQEESRILAEQTTLIEHFRTLYPPQNRSKDSSASADEGGKSGPAGS